MARQAHEMGRAVRSVLDQDFTDFELLIGDETGEAGSLVTRLADPRIDYHRNPTRLGFSKNHMALLDRARGRYLTVLHDDDRWEPTYLSRLVSVLDRHPDVGMACCGVALDRGAGGNRAGAKTKWPVPIGPGRHDDLLDRVLAEEWFLLIDAMIWRREVWAGPAREWPDLCCGDLQFFLSALEARWPLYFLDAVLTIYTVHPGQSGAWRGSDSGLTVADDVLAFWEGWLRGRPEEQVALTALPPGPVAAAAGPGSSALGTDPRSPDGGGPGGSSGRNRPGRTPEDEAGGGAAEPDGPGGGGLQARGVTETRAWVTEMKATGRQP